MPQLPFVCLHCHTVYQRVEVSRPVKLGETASGLCPAHAEEMEDALYGSRAVTQAVEGLR